MRALVLALVVVGWAGCLSGHEGPGCYHYTAQAVTPGLFDDLRSRPEDFPTMRLGNSSAILQHGQEWQLRAGRNNYTWFFYAGRDLLTDGQVLDHLNQTMDELGSAVRVTASNGVIWDYVNQDHCGNVWLAETWSGSP